MPKLVDHEARRRQIIEALWRITARGGLNAASFRQVAGEAGVSVNLIQYYFGTKDQLLLSALGHLAERVSARITRRLTDLGDDPEPRSVIATLFDQFLPNDDQSREAMLLFIAFEAAALTDPSLARAEALQVARDLFGVIANQLRRAQQRSHVSCAIDAEKEAVLVATTLTGLSQGVLAGHFSLDQATGIINYTLDRLFINS